MNNGRRRPLGSGRGRRVRAARVAAVAAGKSSWQRLVRTTRRAQPTAFTHQHGGRYHTGSQWSALAPPFARLAPRSHDPIPQPRHLVPSLVIVRGRSVAAPTLPQAHPSLLPIKVGPRATCPTSGAADVHTCFEPSPHPEMLPPHPPAFMPPLAKRHQTSSIDPHRPQRCQRGFCQQGNQGVMSSLAFSKQRACEVRRRRQRRRPPRTYGPPRA
jgi:hypothetical protein